MRAAPAVRSETERGHTPETSRTRPAAARFAHLLRSWGPETGVLLVIAVVLPTVIAIHYRSLGAPNLDDWAYDLAAFHFAFHGSIDLFHWGPSNLVGQLMLAAPLLRIFGPHAWVLNVWTSFMGLFSLLAIDYTGRQLGLSRRTAFGAVALLGLGPMWAALSTSFMLDIPALSLMSIAIAVASSDERTDRLLTGRSALAVALALIAFTTRDETLVAFLAITWCRLWRFGRPSLRASAPWVGVTLLAVLSLAGFELWRLAIPTSGHGSATIPPSAQWQEDEWLLPFVGLLLTPVALWIRPITTIRRSFRICRLWLIASWALMPGLPTLIFLGRQLEDYVRSGGTTSAESLVREFSPRLTMAYFETLGFPASGPSPWIRLFLGILSLLSTFVIVAALTTAAHGWLRGLRVIQPVPLSTSSYTIRLLAAAIAGSWFVYLAGIQMKYQAWDRYVLPLVAYLPLAVAYTTKSCRSAQPQRATRLRDHYRQLVAGLSLSGVTAMGFLGACSVDGFNGSEWSYSTAFASTVPSTPKRLIYTYWVWAGSQNEHADFSDRTYVITPGYRPCYIEAADGPLAPGELDVRQAGSWIEPLRLAMVVVPGAADDPICRVPKANQSAGERRAIAVPG